MGKVNQVLKYLHSLIDWENTESVNITMDKSRSEFKKHHYVLNGTTDEGAPKYVSAGYVNYVDKDGHNPIHAMLEHISTEMCVECLQIDYLYKDPFFISLAKAYIEYLFVSFGSDVSISKEMSKAFIENDLLGTHFVECHTLDDVILLNKTNYTRYNSDNCIYKLIQ